MAGKSMGVDQRVKWRAGIGALVGAAKRSAAEAQVSEFSFSKRSFVRVRDKLRVKE